MITKAARAFDNVFRTLSTRSESIYKIEIYTQDGSDLLDKRHCFSNVIYDGCFAMSLRTQKRYVDTCLPPCFRTCSTRSKSICKIETASQDGNDLFDHVDIVCEENLLFVVYGECFAMSLWTQKQQMLTAMLFVVYTIETNLENRIPLKIW